MKIESKVIAKSKNSARQYATDYIRGMETGDIYSIHRSLTVDFYFLPRYFIAPKQKIRV